MGLPVLVSDIRKEHKLKVFEYTLVRRLFGPKRYKAIGCWRKLHNEELHNSFSLPIIRKIKRRIKRAGNVARMERKTNA
jgi:hypothetical protein